MSYDLGDRIIGAVEEWAGLVMNGDHLAGHRAYRRFVELAAAADLAAAVAESVRHYEIPAGCMTEEQCDERDQSHARVAELWSSHRLNEMLAADLGVNFGPGGYAEPPAELPETCRRCGELGHSNCGLE